MSRVQFDSIYLLPVQGRNFPLNSVKSRGISVEWYIFISSIVFYVRQESMASSLQNSIISFDSEYSIPFKYNKYSQLTIILDYWNFKAILISYNFLICSVAHWKEQTNMRVHYQRSYVFNLPVIESIYVVLLCNWPL